MDAGCGALEGRTCILGRTRCEAGVLEYCGSDGATRRYDCAANGFAGCEAGDCVPRSD